MPTTTYRTPARQHLMAFFERHPDCHFTAEELYDLFTRPAHGRPIAKSTLYRQLCALCDEGLLQRFDGTDPVTGASVRYYQPIGNGGDCRHHFHLKCTVCGELQHLECDRTAQLLAHLAEQHRFSVDCGKSILFGICEHCRTGESGEDVTPTLCDCGCGKPRHRVAQHGMLPEAQGMRLQGKEEDHHAAHS